MKFSLTISPDLQEEVNYNIEGLPIYACREELEESEQMSLCHWHPDLEFIKIDRGSMYYFINGEILKLEEGHGVFVNSRRLHYGFCTKDTGCTFHVLIFHMDLFAKSCGMIDRYVGEKFGMNHEDYILLSTDVPWQKEVLDRIREMEENIIKKEDPLSLLSDTIGICAGIGNHIRRVRNHPADNKHYQAFLLMTDFIRRHFAEKITIDDIASSGTVCRSLCCSLFRKFASRTPTQYLTNYRLFRSRQALREGQMSVTEISGLCGFQTPSYYASVFKKNFGMTPQEYRSQKNSKRNRNPQKPEKTAGAGNEAAGS